MAPIFSAFSPDPDSSIFWDGEGRQARREVSGEVLLKMWLQRAKPEVRAAELAVIICRFF